MVIKELLQQLETATHPIAKALQKGEHFKVVAIGFKKGMILKEHKSALPAKLVVINGSVLYTEAERTIEMQLYQEVEITPNVLHAVEALDDSLCILIQG